MIGSLFITEGIVLEEFSDKHIEFCSANRML